MPNNASPSETSQSLFATMRIAPPRLAVNLIPKPAPGGGRSGLWRRECGLKAGWSLLHGSPGAIRIEANNRLRGVSRKRRDVLLIDHAILVDEEGVNARDSVFGRPRRQPESSDQRASD